MLRRLLITLCACLLCFSAAGQIVNRLRVDQDTFLRYAYGRMQQFNPHNLALADSLYSVGVRKDNICYKCLALSLEMPIRFSQGDYARMDETALEVKQLLGDRKEYRDFYFTFLHEYCEYLVHIGRASDAVLEARAMERLASSERRPSGKMYSYRIVGLIQSSRDNSYLAIQNMKKAVRFCKEAKSEQDLPNLYLLIAQEYVKMKDFTAAADYLAMAEEYLEFFPGLRIKALMTRTILYHADGETEAFHDSYAKLVSDPLYAVQADSDSRYGIDISYLRSLGMLKEALARTDSLGNIRSRLDGKQSIYAELGDYDKAYANLSQLMTEKDSVYIRVQNEDLAILDAEMNNAQLREEAQQLKARNQLTILLGFLVMFAIAFFAILLSQWQLRRNLDEMRLKNNQMLADRRAFQKAMEAKESENEYRIKILQNRKTNMLRL